MVFKKKPNTVKMHFLTLFNFLGGHSCCNGQRVACGQLLEVCHVRLHQRDEVNLIKTKNEC